MYQNNKFLKKVFRLINKSFRHIFRKQEEKKQPNRTIFSTKHFGVINSAKKKRKENHFLIVIATKKNEKKNHLSQKKYKLKN